MCNKITRRNVFASCLSLCTRSWRAPPAGAFGWGAEGPLVTSTGYSRLELAQRGVMHYGVKPSVKCWRLAILALFAQ